MHPCDLDQSKPLLCMKIYQPWCVCQAKKAAQAARSLLVTSTAQLKDKNDLLKKKEAELAAAQDTIRQKDDMISLLKQMEEVIYLLPIKLSSCDAHMQSAKQCMSSLHIQSMTMSWHKRCNWSLTERYSVQDELSEEDEDTEDESDEEVQDEEAEQVQSFGNLCRLPEVPSLLFIASDMQSLCVVDTLPCTCCELADFLHTPHACS